MLKPQKKALFFTAFLALTLSAATAFAQTANTDARQLEMEQLQAQVDVMLEEVNELQGYRICAEKGKVYDPAQTTRADTDGCVLPTTLPPPQTDAAEKRRAPAAKTTSAGTSRADTGTNKPIAPTAKTFTLPNAAEVRSDVPLNNATAGRPKPAAEFDAPSAAQAEKSAPASGDDILSGLAPPNYPNDKVRRLIEAAVDQALRGNVPEPEALDEAYDTARGSPQAPKATPQAAPQAPQQPQKPDGDDIRQAHKDAVQNLVPSCREGEFLTTSNGKVVCQRAAAAGKMACPPRTLRVYLDWISRHIHFHVGYTPHGQEAQAQEDAHEVTVLCENGNYSLQTVTRNECGGRRCHPSVKPAYTITYYCGRDNTGRCYAKQNGNLVNHTFTEARLSKQY